MTLKSAVVKTGIAIVALTAMGVIAASPASAHTNNMFTLIRYDEATASTGFATYGKADGVATYLGETFSANRTYIAGIEVFDEKGVVLGAQDVGFVQSWDHTNGTVGTALVTYVTVPGAEFDVEINDFVGLDTLNNGTTVTVLYYGEQAESEGPFVDYFAVASVNVGTGEMIPLVGISDALRIEDFFGYEPTGIATDPLTGITYVFLQNEADEPFFLSVDVAAGTVGAPTLLQGDGFEAGRIDGVDFDADGTLFFNYENYPAERIELLKLTARPADWAMATPQFISIAPAQYPAAEIYEQALTLEHTVLAATGSELPVFAIVLVGTVAVLAGGVTVMVARRRNEGIVR